MTHGVPAPCFVFAAQSWYSCSRHCTVPCRSTMISMRTPHEVPLSSHPTCRWGSSRVQWIWSLSSRCVANDCTVLICEVLVQCTAGTWSLHHPNPLAVIKSQIYCCCYRMDNQSLWSHDFLLSVHSSGCEFHLAAHQLPGGGGGGAHTQGTHV